MRTSEQQFREHLLKNASRYFADVSEHAASVDLVRKAERPNSQLYEFRLTDGRAIHHVFVKVPFSTTDAISDQTTTRSDYERPRLFPKANPQLKGLFEYRSLRAIQDYFGQLNDARFGTIRILDLLVDPYTIIMEKGHDRSFGDLFRKAHRLRPESLVDRLSIGCRNSGAWLRAFCGSSPLAHCETRHSRAKEVQADLGAFIEFASDNGGGRRFRHELHRGLFEAAESILPARLPLGIAHTDFAPRNILLSHDGRVTVFDSMSRWRAPIYEDLAYFLIRLKVSVPQMMSQGVLFDASTLARLENEFLCGYFERQPVPMAQIRLYECILLLDQWAAMVYRLRKSHGVYRIAVQFQTQLAQRYLSRYICWKLSEIAA